MRKTVPALRASCLSAALAAALLCSPAAVAQTDKVTADDFRAQNFMGIHFNRGADYMVSKLKAVGFKVVSQDEGNITLERAEKAGPVRVDVFISETNEVHHVIRYAPENLYSTIEDATEALVKKCDALAKDKSSGYELVAPLEIAEGEDVAAGLEDDKDYSCGFAKVATDQDEQFYKQALDKSDPRAKEHKELSQSAKIMLRNRLREHGFGYSLAGDKGAYMVLEETIDFHY